MNQLDWLKQLLLNAAAYLNALQQQKPSQPTNVPSQPVSLPQQAPVKPSAMPAPPLYDWSTPEAARHSVRLICDEERLTTLQKNSLCQTLHCESGFHINAVHPNLYQGKQVSCDYGICQWNDKYHGSEITPDEALHNPEKAVRLMCQYVKRGQLNLWVCWSSGLAHHYTP